MKVGAISIDPVSDGHGAMPPGSLYRATEEQWLPHRQFLDAEGRLPTELGGFLLRGIRGDRVALVDTGLGPLGAKLRMGKFLDSLRSYGVAPEDITDVLLTHLHIDHIGWAVVDSRATFPNATFRCAPADWEFFVEPGGAPEVPLAALIGAPSEREVLLPIADRLELWQEGAVLPGINLTMAPGHTPGSTVIVVSSGTARAVLLGDVVHCPVELVDPEWETVGDVDPDLAMRTRRALIREYEGTDVPMVAAHFAGMQFGRLLPAEGARQWLIA